MQGAARVVLNARAMRLVHRRPILTRAAIVAAALVALGGIHTLAPAIAAAPPTAPPPALMANGEPCAAAAAGGDWSITLMSGGYARSAVLPLPNAPAGKTLPLIVALHGYGGNGPRFAADSGLSTLGDQEGFATVYPTSRGVQWQISGPDRDVTFVSDLLDRVESGACIDTRRVYATGVSSGAGMAARIGCGLSERIAGVVLVSGGYRSLPTCSPDRPVSVLEMHGTSDGTVPYHGQGPGADGAVLPYVAGWAARDRCKPRPTKRLVAAHTILYSWSGCASGAVVEHLRIYGGGHGLPNAPGAEISTGYGTHLSGVRNIWHFLASRTLGLPFPEPSDG
jgi:polyhydroxybutyrate depolymerase